MNFKNYFFSKNFLFFSLVPDHKTILVDYINLFPTTLDIEILERHAFVSDFLATLSYWNIYPSVYASKEENCAFDRSYRREMKFVPHIHFLVHISVRYSKLFVRNIKRLFHSSWTIMLILSWRSINMVMLRRFMSSIRRLHFTHLQFPKNGDYRIYTEKHRWFIFRVFCTSFETTETTKKRSMFMKFDMCISNIEKLRLHFKFDGYCK